MDDLIIRNFVLARKFLEKPQVILETVKALEGLLNYALYNEYGELDMLLNDLRRVDGRLKHWIDSYNSYAEEEGE